MRTASRSSSRLVLRQAFQRVAVGLVVGLPLAVGAAKAWRRNSVAYRSGTHSPHGGHRIARSVRVFAAIIPAGRAAAVSPMSALRTE